MKLPNEEKAIATIMAMAEQSLTPDDDTELERIIAQLCETRSVNIDNEILTAEHKKLEQLRITRSITPVASMGR